MRIRVLGQTVPASIAVLAATEAAVAYLAIYAAVCIRFETPIRHLGLLQEQIGVLWPRAGLFAAIVVVCLLAFGLYSARQRAQLSGVLVRVVASLLIASAAVAAAFYLFPELRLWRGVEALAVILTGCGITISRIVFVRVVNQDIFKRRILVYGAGSAAGAVAALRRASDRRGFQLVGFVQPPNEHRTVPAERLLDAQGDLRGLCENMNVNEVVVAMDDRRRGFPIRELLDCRLAGVDVTELLTFLERETGRVRVDVLEPELDDLRPRLPPRSRAPVLLAHARSGCEPRGARGLLPGDAADGGGDQAGGRHHGAGALQPAARRTGRTRVQRAEVPQHAPGRRAERRPVGAARRPARDARRRP